MNRAGWRFNCYPGADYLVLRLIELATKSPSGSNQQNWEFVVVRDRAVKERLGRLNRMAFSLYSRIGRRTADAKMQRIIDAVQWQADHFEDIPVLVVACSPGVRPPFPPIPTAHVLRAT